MYTSVLQRHALKMEDILLETATRCRAVICCRVTPLQKVIDRHVYSTLFCTANTVIPRSTCIYMYKPGAHNMHELAWQKTSLFTHVVNIHVHVHLQVRYTLARPDIL